MGFNPTIQINTTMKTILLICAFAALASAHPSDDVATDLLTVTEAHADDVVPETNFAQETAKVGGHWTDCKLGHGDCAKPTIYTASRVHHCKTKKACQYKVDTKLQAGIVTRTYCSKWDKNNCDQWHGQFNARAKRGGVVGHIPFCHELNSEKHTLCKCKGKHQDWKGKGKACFAGPNPKKTRYCYSSGKRAGTCKDLEYKQGKWSPSEVIMGACNSNGYAYASTCSYPKGIKRKAPKKAKVCACHVEGYKTSEIIHLKEGQGKKHHDHRGKDNHVMKCCGKKKCRFEAKGGVFSHGWDLRDDVSHIELAHPC